MISLYLPTGRTLLLNIVTVLAGMLGGFAASSFGMPLPYFIGAMISSAIYGFIFPALISKNFRNVMMAILGVLIGGEFTIAFLKSAVDNAISIAFMIPYTIISTIIILFMLLRTTTLDITTAYFSAVPGGVQEMTMLGADRGGSEATLAVHHSLRVTLVIVIVSLIFSLLSGYQLSAAAAASKTPLVPTGYGWIAGMALLGLALGHYLNFPAPFILGPLLVSAIVHVVGMTDVKPDFTIVTFAQVVAGASIGVQFSIFKRRDLMLAGLTALQISATLIIFTILFVWAVSAIVGQPFPTMLLAFAPGGLGEMGLIALSAGSDAAFVSTGQIFRYFLVVTFAAPCYRLFVLMNERHALNKKSL